MGKFVGDHRSIMEKSFWAFSVTAGRVDLIRCDSAEEAKAQPATFTSQRRRSEAAARKLCRKRGWRINCIHLTRGK